MIKKSNDCARNSNTLTIAIFTSNKKGGIVQFALELYRQIYNLGVNVYCFLPETTPFTTLEDMSCSNIIHYTIKRLNNRAQTIDSLLRPARYDVKEIVETINKYNIDVFWGVDDQILTNAIVRQLKKSEVHTIITIHDVTMHPSEDDTTKTNILRNIYLAWRKITLKYVDTPLVLSEQSKNKFDKRYPKYKDKVHLLTLGAFIPSFIANKPIEVNFEPDSFYLFFGRFDKYKGIDTLIDVFTHQSCIHNKLVIAGEGLISERVVQAGSYCENIILIKRYISDEEMIWLIKNSTGVILPYTEASQSGILPISYFFGVPVIVSDVDGLKQFVVDGKTGFVCRNVDDYLAAIEKLNTNTARESISCFAKEYYDLNLSWPQNIIKILALFYQGDSIYVRKN